MYHSGNRERGRATAAVPASQLALNLVVYRIDSTGQRMSIEMSYAK